MGDLLEARQSSIDAFYRHFGPCCAGCDWWHSINSVAGECRRGPPVAEGDRCALLGIESASIGIGSGHVMTPRHHVCGEFKDTYDWADHHG